MDEDEHADKNSAGKPARVPQHGTYGEYTNHKCRCVPCRAANTRYNLKRRKERRKRLLASNPSIVTHGEYSTYTNWGCRCPECKRANAERVHKPAPVESSVPTGSDPEAISG